MATIILNPTADTFMDRWNPTVNYNAGGLRIGAAGDNTEVYNSLLRFNFAGIAPCTINSASLALNVYSWGGGSNTVKAYRVRTGRDWVAAQANWNIYKTSNSWGTAGCKNTASDRYATVIGTQAMVYGNNNISLNASEIQSMVDEGSGNQGIVIASNNGASPGSVLCRDVDSGTNIPALTIDYTPRYTPTTDSVSPDSGSYYGSKQTQTFTFAFSDQDGYANIDNCYAIFGANTTGANSAYLRYDRTNNLIYLRNDANDDWGTGYAPGAAQTLSNSQCYVYIANCTASGASNTVTVAFSVRFKVAYAGTYNIYMKAVDIYSLDSGWSDKGDATVTSNAPALVSASPASGTYSTLKSYYSFIATYSDIEAYANIDETYFIIGPDISGANSIYLRYDRTNNLLYLANDAGNDWGTGYAPGVAQVLQNTQCYVNVANCSVSQSGYNVAVTYSVKFKDAYAGSAELYMKALDIYALDSDWSDKGDATIVTRPPVNVSVSPNTGNKDTCLETPFVITVTDADGYTDLDYVLFLISDASANLANRLYAKYEISTNMLYLRNDANDSWGTGQLVGGDSNLSNTQGAIITINASAVGGANTLTLTIPIVAANAYAGVYNLYVKSADLAGHTDGWDDLGDLTYDACTITNVYVNPSSGQYLADGIYYNFTTVHHTTIGGDQINDARLLVTGLDGLGLVYVRYDGSKFYLRNDGDTSWGTGYTPGTAQILENSQGRFNIGNSTATVSGDELTIVWNLNFKEYFIKTAYLYMYSKDTAANEAVLELKGTATIFNEGTASGKGISVRVSISL